MNPTKLLGFPSRPHPVAMSPRAKTLASLKTYSNLMRFNGYQLNAPRTANDMKQKARAFGAMKNEFSIIGLYFSTAIPKAAIVKKEKAAFYRSHYQFPRGATFV